MPIIQHGREVSPLPEVARPFPRAVYPLGIAQMQGPERELQRVRGGRHQYQVSVIGHQAVSENRNLVLGGVLAKQGQVGLMISF